LGLLRHASSSLLLRSFLADNDSFAVLILSDADLGLGRVGSLRVNGTGFDGKHGAFTLSATLLKAEVIDGVCEGRTRLGGVKGLLADPGMLEDLVDRKAFNGVNTEHTLDQAECGIADGIPVGGREVVQSLLNLLREAVWVFRGVELIRKGRESTEADVQDNTKGPDVYGLVVATIGSLQDLGGNVTRGAAESGGEGGFADDFGESEVGKFNRKVGVGDEDVLRLDVAVGDFTIVLGGR
jgi:hypothetical protein